MKLLKKIVDIYNRVRAYKLVQNETTPKFVDLGDGILRPVGTKK